jgi:very-short-patch-repair endonuclease
MIQLSKTNQRNEVSIVAEKKEKQYVSDNARLMAEWNWEKNNELGFDPNKLTCGSDKKPWWKCNRNHSWQSAISSRASGIGCPMCAKELQSSFPEKAVYFYIKKIFRDAIANYRSNQLNTFELDIFIPSLQIGVEYDGDRWHRSSEKDLQKNKLCAQMGIVLIRIREPNCPILLDNLSSYTAINPNPYKEVLDSFSFVCHISFGGVVWRRNLFLY